MSPRESLLVSVRRYRSGVLLPYLFPVPHEVIERVVYSVVVQTALALGLSVSRRTRFLPVGLQISIARFTKEDHL